MMLKDRLLEPEVGRVDDEKASDVEDDGRSRTGTVWTATTHVITAVIGSGVLALPWSVAQLGWIFGPLGLIVFALITYYTATLLSDCYRTPDPIKGKRNSTYIDVVRSCLGPRDVLLCGVVQYVMLWGTLVGYTVTTAMSMVAVDRSNCIHYSKEESPAGCEKSGNKYIILFGLLEVVLSQFPNLEEITLISVIAAAMSFAYSLIGLYFCLAKFISNHSIKGTIFGPEVGFNGLTQADRVWHGFQALGNIAFAYTYATILIEIQDTLKSNPPENKTMKKASQNGVGVTTVFYVLLGCIGYAAFGNDAPGNLLSGVPEPFWLVDIANLAVVIHLIGAYQVYAQPIFAKHEAWLCSTWPETPVFHRVYTVTIPFRQSPSFSFTPCTLILRTLYVVMTTWISMMLPFFNAIVGLLGAVAFWPLTVYYPVTMYMAQAKIRKGQPKWLMLQGLSVAALFVSLAAAVGSVTEIVEMLKTVTFFG